MHFIESDVKLCIMRRTANVIQFLNKQKLFKISEQTGAKFEQCNKTRQLEMAGFAPSGSPSRHPIKSFTAGCGRVDSISPR